MDRFNKTIELISKYCNKAGHDINHINYVINRSFELVNEFNLDVDLNMVYVFRYRKYNHHYKLKHYLVYLT